MPHATHATSAPARRRTRAAALALACAGLAAPLALAPASGSPTSRPAAAAPADTIKMTPLGTYSTGFFEEGGSEIVAWDHRRFRAFSINAKAGTVDVLDVSDPTKPSKVATLDTPGANSVAVRGNVVAVALQAEDKTRFGSVRLFSAETLKRIGSYPTAALPDMVTISANGRYVLTANEGEPSGYCSGDRDPQGAVTVVDLRTKRAVNAKFTQFDRLKLRQAGVRLFGPRATVTEDLEPEYIAISSDSTKAYVTLQENNAIAVLDLASKTFTRINSLGLKDHSLPGNGLDASDRDGGVNIKEWPVQGYFMPDAVAAYKVGTVQYLVTANEGDARDYDCFAEEARVKDVTLDPAVFPDAAELQANGALGRLTMTTTSPRSKDGYTRIRTFGARSISVRDAATGKLVWDSGDQIERMIAERHPELFNADHAENDSADSRSDNKGPEPEGVSIGRIGARAYAFAGLERNSGIAVFDITDPKAPRVAGFGINRDAAGDPEAGTAGDLGPEGVHFVPGKWSPTGKNLLLVGNEVSGTTTVWQVDRV